MDMYFHFCRQIYRCKMVRPYARSMLNFSKTANFFPKQFYYFTFPLAVGKSCRYSIFLSIFGIVFFKKVFSSLKNF